MIHLGWHVIRPAAVHAVGLGPLTLPLLLLSTPLGIRLYEGGRRYARRVRP